MNKIDALNELIRLNTKEMNKLSGQETKVRSALYDIRNFKSSFMSEDIRTVQLKLSKGSLYGNSTHVQIDVPNSYLLERLRQKFMDEKRTLNAMGIEFDNPFGEEV